MLWFFNNPTVNFSGVEINTGRVIAGLLAGIGGGKILTTAVERAVQDANLEQTRNGLERTTRVLKHLQPGGVSKEEETE